jgi:hypothetical protein
MSKTLVAIAVAAGLAVGSSAINRADALPLGDISGVRAAIDDLNIIDDAQYVWGGRRYCWYVDAWRGPGWYQCGYAWRRGLGWGGPQGWRGWGGPGYGVYGPGPGYGYYRRGPGWRW